MIHHKKKKRAKNTKNLSPQESAHARKPIPYIGLTQTCAQIRGEFRPMWLSSHQIPLECIATYINAFFPARLPGAKSFEPDALGPASLRVWITEPDVEMEFPHDATQLFKFKARFPDCIITWRSLPREEWYLRGLNTITNYNDTVWLKSLRGRSAISQIRLGLLETVAVNVVVKEAHSEPWMKTSSHWPTDSEYDLVKKRFGLDQDHGWDRDAVEGVVIEFSVDYS